MTLSGANGYSGTTNVNGGALQLGADGVLPDGTVVTLSMGGALDINGRTETVGRLYINDSTISQANGDLTTSAPSDWGFGVGYDAGTTGVYNMSGGTLTIANNGNVAVGTFGTGTFNQTGGEVFTSSWTVMGRKNGSTGTYSISTGSLNHFGTGTRIIVGEQGTGTLTVSGTGEVITTDGLRIGMDYGGSAGNGTVNLNGGSITTPFVETTGGTSAFNFNGGLLTASADSGAFMTGLTSANVQAGGAKIDTQSFTITIAQALLDGGGNGGLTKNGSGTLTLTGVNTYKGNTVVNEGVLSLQNACIDDASSVTIAAGAIMHLNFDGGDTVASVTLGTTTYTTPGSYDATTYPDFFTGDGSLVIPGANDYATWSGPSGYNLAEGPDGDDDKDGITNREEYAFGLVPTSGSSANPVTNPLNKATGQFTYTRRDPVTKNTGLTYTIWTSTNLTNWNPESDSSAVQTPGTPDANGIQSVLVTLTPIPTAPKLFIQVRAN
jgi:autotransporter-associated beta strand protein